jgi:hypothetical protein
MPIYRLRRHVIYRPGYQETEEVWGIDRRLAALPTVCAPRDTDTDDPLRSRSCGTPLLLKLADGDFVTWHRLPEWLSEAEAAGYELVSGYKHMSPYSTLILRGP